MVSWPAIKNVISWQLADKVIIGEATACEGDEKKGGAFGVWGWRVVLCTLDSGTADSLDDLGCVGGKTVSLNAVF